MIQASASRGRFLPQVGKLPVIVDDLHNRWREDYEQAKLRTDKDFDTLSSEPLEREGLVNS